MTRKKTNKTDQKPAMTTRLGRPPAGPESLTEAVRAKLPASLLRALSADADGRGVSISTRVREILAAHFASLR